MSREAKHVIARKYDQTIHDRWIINNHTINSTDTLERGKRNGGNRVDADQIAKTNGVYT